MLCLHLFYGAFILMAVVNQAVPSQLAAFTAHSVLKRNIMRPVNVTRSTENARVKPALPGSHRRTKKKQGRLEHTTKLRVHTSKTTVEQTGGPKLAGGLPRGASTLHRVLTRRTKHFLSRWGGVHRASGTFQGGGDEQYLHTLGCFSLTSHPLSRSRQAGGKGPWCPRELPRKVLRSLAGFTAWRARVQRENGPSHRFV